MPNQSLNKASWQMLSASKIEDLADAVLGAGLLAEQFDPGQFHASLAFRRSKGVTTTPGMLMGRTLLSGILSKDQLTLGLGLHMPSGSRHWMKPVQTGTVGVFRPGDYHEAYYLPGSLYVGLTMSLETLAAEAECAEVHLDPVLLVTGHAEEVLPGRSTVVLQREFSALHRGAAEKLEGEGYSPETATLQALIRHLGRAPVQHSWSRSGHGALYIVSRARDFIESSFAERIDIDDIARASGSSRRSLHRAFADILNDTPIRYLNRRRLHNVRRVLLADGELSVTHAGSLSGLSELGRLSVNYRALFGESPSDTRRGIWSVR